MPTAMTASILSAIARSGQFVGLRRTEIVEKKIKAGLPFTVIDDGKEKKIIMQSYDKKTFSFLDKKGQWKYSLNSLIKDEDFGGQPGKGGGTKGVKLGGKITEALTEGFFCVYLALHLKGKLKSFSPSELTKKSGNYTSADFTTWCSTNIISTILKYALKDTQFTKEAKHYYNYLTGINKTLKKSMHEVFTEQVLVFSKENTVNLNQGFFIMRQGQLKDTGGDPYGVFADMAKSIKSKYSLSQAPKDDKWNPADVWVIDNAGITELKDCVKLAREKKSAPANFHTAVLNHLNSCIQDLWEKKHLYPVSLKLPGGAVKVTLENDKSPGGLAKVVRYEKFELKNSNQDIQLFFSIDYVENHSRKMVRKNAFKLRLKTKTKTGGHRLEIESQTGGGARYGTVGLSSQEYILANTVPSADIDKLQKHRKEFSKLIELGYLDASSNNKWINVDEMSKKFNEDSKKFKAKITPYFISLFDKVGDGDIPKNKDAEFYLNKTHSAEIGYLMKSITGDLVKSELIKNWYDIANSQRFAVGISPQAVEKHKKMKGNCKMESIDPTNKNGYEILFESSFHYVVK